MKFKRRWSGYFAGGGMGPAYPSIVASGSNACVLHYIENNRQMQITNCCWLMPVVPMVITTLILPTFPVGGKFTPEQRLYMRLFCQLKAVVLKSNPAIPTTLFTTQPRLTERFSRTWSPQGWNRQVDWGGKIQAILYAPHWTLARVDVHDVVYQHGESAQILQPGQVLTVEPGLYIVSRYQGEDQPDIDPRWVALGFGLRMMS